MSTKKKLLIVGGLLGSTMLVTGMIGGAGAFGGGPRGMGCERMGGHAMGGHGMGRHGGFGGGMLRFADADKDGVVTREEALKPSGERFAGLDLNKDGGLTPEEAINARIARFTPQVQRMVRGLDANADGKVSREEFAAPMRERLARRFAAPQAPADSGALATRIDQRFARLDRDKDGGITAAEMIAGRTARFEGQLRRWVRGLDANGDGKVSQEEFAAPLTERFGFLDSDGDGKLTVAELPPRMAGDGARRGWRHGPHGRHGGWGGWGDRFMPGGPAATPDDLNAPEGPDAGPDGMAPDAGAR